MPGGDPQLSGPNGVQSNPYGPPRPGTPGYDPLANGLYNPNGINNQAYGLSDNYTGNDYNNASGRTYGGIAQSRDEYGNVIMGTGSAAEEAARYSSLGKAAASRQLDANGQIATDRGYQDFGRQGQQQLIGQLQQAAAGNGPSVATMQMGASTDQALRAQMAAAHSAPGGLGAALASRNAAQQGAQTLENAAQQSAIMRMQEQQAARAQLGGALQQNRAAEMQGQGMDLQQAYEQAQLQQSGQLAWEGMSQGVNEAQLSANLAGQGQDIQKWNDQMQTDEQSAQMVNQNLAAGASAVASMYGMGAKSDVRDKKEVRSEGQSDVDRFLAHLHPSSYRYKDPADEPTDQPKGSRYLGIMAQDVERSPTGDTIVRDTPRGKVVEALPMMSAMAAGLGRLHERMRELEAKRDGGKPEMVSDARAKEQARAQGRAEGMAAAGHFSKQADAGEQKDPNAVAVKSMPRRQAVPAETPETLATVGHGLGLRQGSVPFGLVGQANDYVLDRMYGPAQPGQELANVRANAGVAAHDAAAAYREAPFGVWQAAVNPVADRVLTQAPPASQPAATQANMGGGLSFRSDARAKMDAHDEGVKRGLAMGLSAARAETTALTPEQERGFQTWAHAHQIRDVDHPDSHYDYRGAYLAGVEPGADAHWPDTFKQHGHPTFSEESQYSQGPGDGGRWVAGQYDAPGEYLGEVDDPAFLHPAPPAQRPSLSALLSRDAEMRHAGGGLTSFAPRPTMSTVFAAPAAPQPSLAQVVAVPPDDYEREMMDPRLYGRRY